MIAVIDSLMYISIVVSCRVQQNEKLNKAALLFSVRKEPTEEVCLLFFCGFIYSAMHVTGRSLLLFYRNYSATIILNT